MSSREVSHNPHPFPTTDDANKRKSNNYAEQTRKNELKKQIDAAKEESEKANESTRAVC